MIFIKLLTVSSTWQLRIHLLMNLKFRIMKIQILFLSKKHLNKSTGTRYVIKKVLMNKLNHLIKK